MPVPSLAPALQEPSSIEKVAEIDSHIGVAMSGLTADAKTLVDHGRVEAQQHAFTYNESMPVESLTQVCAGVGGGGTGARSLPASQPARGCAHAQGTGTD